MLRFIIKLFLAILFGVQTFGQNSNYLFKQLTVDDGLSENNIYSILQDSDGFMWFGTDAGLNKFDGYEFTVYQHNSLDSNSIQGNYIVELFEDSYGNFWVGSGYRGLSLFDKKEGIFKRVIIESTSDVSGGHSNIREIFEDSNRNLWLGTGGGGLYLYDRESELFKPFIRDTVFAGSIVGKFISSIAEDNSGNLWIGSTAGSLTKLNISDTSFTTFNYYHVSSGELFNTYFSEVYIDRKDRVWFCTELGLYCYNQETEKTKKYTEGTSMYNLSSNRVTSIQEIEPGIFFISTDHGGLNILNVHTGIIEKHFSNKFDETTISNNQLYNVYKSKEGIIWIGSFRGGVNYYDANAIKFNQLKYILQGEERLNCCASVLDIAESQDGNIWVGTDGGGIQIYHPYKGLIKNYEGNGEAGLNSGIITTLVTDGNGDIWVGTYQDGMYRYDWDKQVFKHFEENLEDKYSIHGDNVWDIAERDDSTLWIGCMGDGLGLFAKSGKLLKSYLHQGNDSTSLSNNDVFVMLYDSHKNLWIGTRNGLNRYDAAKDRFIRYENSKAPYGFWITEIFEDSEGIIWVGTDAGLNKYHPKSDSFTSYTLADGLPGNQIFNIREDSNNNLWLSSNQGLARFNKKTEVFKNFDISDGIQGKVFNYSTALVDSRGLFFFGGTNGFNVFHPDSIKENKQLPKVFITRLSVSNKQIIPDENDGILERDIAYTKSIKLTHKQSIFSLRFAAISYTNTSKNRYKYILEGFDKAWVDAGTRREVSYTNLNPGKYTFKVIASNNDGLWNEEPTILEIEIVPPIWKTKWFLILEVFLLIIFVLLTIYFRVKKLESDKATLTRKVKERTKQIETQKKELEQNREHLENKVAKRTKQLTKAKEMAEESDRLKSAFLANMSHEIRTPMNAIVGFSNLLLDTTIEESEKIEFIELIHSNSDTLLRLIEDILDLSLIEADQLTLKPSEFSLNNVVDNVFSTISLNHQNSFYEIIKNNSVEDLNLTLNCDKFRLSQVLFNLLNNACKFTSDGFVELHIEKHPNYLQFNVKDTGMGIPEEEQSKVFKRFRRNDNKDNFRGIGLGLAISKRLSELLGGTLSLVSQEGEGSTFTLKLPADLIVDKAADQTKEPKSNQTHNWQGKKVLIAEDEEMNYLYLKHVLQKTNIEVFWAKNGEEAVEIVEKEKGLDIVLMDIRMPKMDGFEALRIIQDVAPHLVVIAQTANARPEDELKVIAAGFKGYIAKPIIINNLLSEMNRHLHG